jgi:hypothetical protein
MVRVLHDQKAFSEVFVGYLLTRNVRFQEDLIDQLFNSSENAWRGRCVTCPNRQRGHSRDRNLLNQPGPHGDDWSPEMGARFHPAGQASASCNHCPYSGGTQLSPSRAAGFFRVCMVAFKSLLLAAIGTVTSGTLGETLPGTLRRTVSASYFSEVPWAQWRSSGNREGHFRSRWDQLSY